MKTLLFIVLALISLNAVSQNDYLELRKAYQQHCDSIVIDTIEEQGSVHYKINNVAGDLKLVPKDTIWYEVVCPQYKNNIYAGIISNWSSYNTNANLSISGYVTTPTYSKSVETITTDISRFKYCKCKYKRGSQEDFWNWVEQNYLK